MTPAEIEMAKAAFDAFYHDNYAWEESHANVRTTWLRVANAVKACPAVRREIGEELRYKIINWLAETGYPHTGEKVGKQFDAILSPTPPIDPRLATLREILQTIFNRNSSITERGWRRCDYCRAVGGNALVELFPHNDGCKFGQLVKLAMEDRAAARIG